jgi:hypothetical protein
MKGATMFSKYFIDEVVADIKQQDFPREASARTPLYPRRNRNSKRLFIAGV